MARSRSSWRVCTLLELAEDEVDSALGALADATAEPPKAREGTRMVANATRRRVLFIRIAVLREDVT
ncbi:hypothetical protein GCM10027294_36170 [Marinactinospora endophytica]